MSNLELWEINQGKRLLKRMHKCGVQKGLEFQFLFQALKNAAAVVAVDIAKGQGCTADQATAAALEAMQRVKPVDLGEHSGEACFRLLVENGAAPGRCKSELDKVLFLCGHSMQAPLDATPSTMFARPAKGCAVVLAVDEAQHIDIATGAGLDALAKVAGVTRSEFVDQESADRFPQHNTPRDNY